VEAGEEFLFPGPGTYIPRNEADVVDIVDGIVLSYDEGLLVRAKQVTTDLLIVYDKRWLNYICFVGDKRLLWKHEKNWRGVGGAKLDGILLAG
jgi:hypothetical protein